MGKRINKTIEHINQSQSKGTDLSVGDIIYIDFPHRGFKWANGLKIVIHIDDDTLELCDINSKGEPALYSDGTFMVSITSKNNLGITKTNLKYIFDGNTKSR